jgi:hypothetical protein
VKPTISEGPGALVAEYGALREKRPSRERIRQLGEVLVGLLRDSGIDAEVRDEDPASDISRPKHERLTCLGQCEFWLVANGEGSVCGHTRAS